MKNKLSSIQIRYILTALGALLLCCIIPYIVGFSDVAILTLIRMSSAEKTGSYTVEELLSQDYNQPMNKAYMMIAQFSLFIIIFGNWFNISFIKPYKEITSKQKKLKDFKAKLPANIKKFFTSPLTYILIVCGISGQILVDSLLNIASARFPDAFESYNQLVSDTVGASSSVAMLFCVMILAPFGEEILFRGLILGLIGRAADINLFSDEAASKIIKEKDNNKIDKALIAVVILSQAVIFGIYHGNVIQCIYASLLGILLGYIAYRANSIKPCILLHIALNSSVLLVQEEWFEFTSSCIITGSISLVVFAISIFLILKNYNKKELNS